MENTTKVTTNNHWRYFIYGYELPLNIKQDFDWLQDDENNIDIDSESFIKYRNRYYHLQEFMSLHNKIYCSNPPEFMEGYDGCLSDSYFSGILIKLSDCNGMYKVAKYISL